MSISLYKVITQFIKDLNKHLRVSVREAAKKISLNGRAISPLELNGR